MIKKIEILGTKYEVSDDLKKYVEKRLGKLDKYLPKDLKENAELYFTVVQINRPHGSKYEVSARIEAIKGEEVIAKDEVSNVFSGVDILEAKMLGQLRRIKTERDKSSAKRRGIWGFFKKK
jgi:ribosomal subunit interface protein